MRTTTILAVAALLGLGVMVVRVRALESDVAWHNHLVEHRLRRLCEEHAISIAAVQSGADPDVNFKIHQQASRASDKCQVDILRELDMSPYDGGLHPWNWKKK